MKKILVLILALVIAMSGCSTPVKDNTNDKQQVFTQVYSEEITTLNYFLTGVQNDQAAVANFVDTLIEYDKYGIMQPCLAKEWNVSEDGLVWTLKLREDAKWYTFDGKEYGKVTAQDFVDGAKYAISKETASPIADLLFVLKNTEEFFNGDITDFTQVGIKAIDTYTLEYTLKQKTPYFMSMLTYASYLPMNGAFKEEMGDSFGTNNDKILYNGAYLMQTWEQQSKRVYVANENYWDKENIFINKVNMTYNKEAEVLAAELFLRGEVSSADVSASLIEQWMSEEAKAAQIRPNRVTGTFSYFYTLNFDPKFDKKYEPENWKIAVNNFNFRKALFHGLNREAAMLTQEPNDPKSKLTNTITPVAFAATNGVDYTQMGDLKKITETDSYNKEKAVEYKEKAMAELIGKATFPIKIYMPNKADDGAWTQRGQVVKQQLEGLLGADFIEIICEGYPSTGFLKVTRQAGNYALQECRWGPDYQDPMTYADPFDEGSSYNFAWLAEGVKEENGKSKYDNMILAAAAEVEDLGKRYELFANAEAYFINQAYVIPYCLEGFGYVASNTNPFDAQYSPFGVSALRYKGQKIMDKAMNTEEFNAELIKWNKEREEALKATVK